jgi:hypothetical protein
MGVILLQEGTMKRITLLLFAAAAFALSGCCVNKIILSGNGNVQSGTIGATIDIEYCNGLEEKVVDQLLLVSQTYHADWEKCAATQDPPGCRAEVTMVYEAQMKALQAILASMKGKPEEEQKAILDEARAKGRLKPLQ